MSRVPSCKLVKSFEDINVGEGPRIEALRFIPSSSSSHYYERSRVSRLVLDVCRSWCFHPAALVIQLGEVSTDSVEFVYPTMSEEHGNMDFKTEAVSLIRQLHNRRSDYGIISEVPGNRYLYTLGDDSFQVLFPITSRDVSPVQALILTFYRSVKGSVSLTAGLLGNRSVNRLLGEIAKDFNLACSMDNLSYRVRFQDQDIGGISLNREFEYLQDTLLYTDYPRPSNTAPNIENAIGTILRGPAFALSQLHITLDSQGRRVYTGPEEKMQKEWFRRAVEKVLADNAHFYPLTVPDRIREMVEKRLELNYKVGRSKNSILNDYKARILLSHKLNPAELSEYLAVDADRIQFAIHRMKQTLGPSEFEFKVMTSNPSTLADHLKQYLDLPELQLVETQ